MTADLFQVNEKSHNGEEDVFRSIQQSVDDGDTLQLSALLIRTGLVGDSDADDSAALYLRLLKTLSLAKRRHIRITNSVIVTTVFYGCSGISQDVLGRPGMSWDDFPWHCKC